MHILELPEELLQLILVHLPTDALINTHRSSHALHSVTAKLVHQRKLKHFFTYLDLTSRLHRKRKWTHPAQILYNIDNEPEISSYIKAILWDSTACDFNRCESLARLPPYWAGCEDPGKFTKEQLMADLGWGSDYLERIPLLGGDMRGYWEYLGRSGNWGPFLVMLLVFCPNLELLRILEGFTSDHFLNRDLDPFLDHAIIHRLPLFACEDSCSKGLPHLRTLVLDAGESPYATNLLFVQKWLCIPTLRTFGSLFLKAFNNTPYQYGDVQPTWNPDLNEYCNLEIVVMALASLPPPLLAVCVKGMPKLKRLVYSDELHFEGGSYRDNANGDDMFWDDVETYIDLFVQAYGRRRWKDRGLQTALGTGTSFQFFQDGCASPDHMVAILSSVHSTTGDVEHYLQQAA